MFSEEFNELCVSVGVEVSIKPMANPGDPYKSIRMLEFRNFNDYTIRVRRQDSRNTVSDIPAKGSIQLVLQPNEPLPGIERAN